MADETALRGPEQLLTEATAVRIAWLDARTGEDLVSVEARYKALIKQAKRGTKETANPKFRGVTEDATQRLALLLCQHGRDSDAAAVLGKKFVARLAPCVLNYPVTAEDVAALASPTAVDARAGAPPCIVLDGVLSPRVLAQLDRAFLAPTADYWVAHRYCVEPPTPYFSYVTEVAPAAAGGLGAFGALIRAGVAAIAARWGPERAAAAKYAELWAHNRPHPSGHQMHFDSDDEGRGGVRNPIASGVVYLTTAVGGPTLVTNQRLSDVELASRGWVAHPKRNRMVVFDGTVLHGVVPGKGVLDVAATNDTRRVTVMIALWEDIRLRPGAEPGAARPLPQLDATSVAAADTWLSLLCGAIGGGGATGDDVADAPPPLTEVAPLALPHVWTSVASGEVWPRGVPMPPYEKAFQGF